MSSVSWEDDVEVVEIVDGAGTVVTTYRLIRCPYCPETHDAAVFAEQGCPRNAEEIG